MDLALRDSRPEDFETLWSIDQLCFAPGIAYSRRELRSYINFPQALTLVAESSARDSGPARILGFLVASARRSRAGHIITIDVLPEARRFGVGSKLLCAAEGRLEAAGCLQVTLETAVDNHSALLFYKHHQYFLVNTIPRYYSNGVDALVLQKDLLSTARAS
jgi:[ribosomal protein S18]-alanine N-acetyltransferase